MPREWSAWLERVAACAAALLTSGDTQVVQASIPTPFLYPPSHIGKCIRTGATVHGGRTQSYIESQIRVSGIRSETSPPTRESEMIKCALLHALEYMPYLDADTGGGATHGRTRHTRSASCTLVTLLSRSTCHTRKVDGCRAQVGGLVAECGRAAPGDGT